MEESLDSTQNVHLNGDGKRDPINLVKSALINKDVMLSGTTIQSPVSTVSPASIPTPIATMAPQSYGDHFFMSIPHHTSAAENTYSLASKALTTAAPQQPILSQPQILLAGQIAQGATTLPLQQLLIPVSTANGSQQLFTLPMGAAGAQPFQILTTAGGQLIAANLASLPGLMALNPGTPTVSAPSSFVDNKTSTTASHHMTQLTQQLLSSGQLLAMGAPLLPSAPVTQALAPPNTTVHHIPKTLPYSLGKETAINLVMQMPTSVSSHSHQLSAKPQSPEPVYTYPSVTASAAHAVTVTATPNTQVSTPLPSIQTLTQPVSVINPATTNGLPPNINQLLPNTVSNTNERTTVDGINLDEIKEFARQFKIRRLSLGLTQTQVGQALSATEGPAYSQSAICRFEKLDITPKSAQKIKPVLEKWMREAEERYKNGVHTLTDFIGSEPSKKRKRRTSFTPQAVDALNEFFERNTHPSGAEMTEMSDKLNYDREVIRVWFCNKRQALKNTIKRLKASDGSYSTGYPREDIFTPMSTENIVEKTASNLAIKTEQTYVVNSRERLPSMPLVNSMQKSSVPAIVTS